MVLCGSFYFAYQLGQPYVVRRGGALLVIYSLIFAFRAHLLDEAKDRLEEKEDAPVPPFAPPKIKLEHELRKEIGLYHRSMVVLSVSRVFRVHLLMAAVGEMLHGFGDLIYIGIFGPVADGH